MKETVYVRPGQNVTIDVEIISYPIAYWARCFFTPCKESYCPSGRYFEENQITLSMVKYKYPQDLSGTFFF